MLYALLLATCFNAARYCSLWLSPAFPATVPYYHCNYTHYFWHSSSQHSSLQPPSQFLLSVIVTFFLTEREKMHFTNILLCFINNNMLKSGSLQLVSSACIWLVQHLQIFPPALLILLIMSPLFYQFINILTMHCLHLFCMWRLWMYLSHLGNYRNKNN